MPFKSIAQKKKFEQLVADGKMSQDTFNKWESETPKGKLPERIGPKKEKFTSMEQVKNYSKRKYSK